MKSYTKMVVSFVGSHHFSTNDPVQTLAEPCYWNNIPWVEYTNVAWQGDSALFRYHRDTTSTSYQVHDDEILAASFNADRSILTSFHAKVDDYTYSEMGSSPYYPDQLTNACAANFIVSNITLATANADSAVDIAEGPTLGQQLTFAAHGENIFRSRAQYRNLGGQYDSTDWQSTSPRTQLRITFFK